MTSNHHASYVLGYKRATMAITKRAEAVTQRKPGKDSLSSDCGLKLTHTKMKLLVIPNQNVGVNAWELEGPKAGEPTCKGGSRLR